MDCVLLLNTFSHLLARRYGAQFGCGQGNYVAQFPISHSEHAVQVKNFQLVRVAVGHDS